MSGGGTRVSRGRMGSSVLTEVDPKELYKMEQELDEVLGIFEERYSQDNLCNDMYVAFKRISVCRPQRKRLLFEKAKIN